MAHPFPLAFSPREFQGRGAPEKRLWFAVLMDAIGCYLRQVGLRDERDRLYREAADWITVTLENTAQDPSFNSFIGVCELLGVPADRLRRALRDSDVPLTIAFDRLAQPRKAPIAVDVYGVFALFEDGFPIPVIARRFGVSRRAIHRILGPQTPGVPKRRRTATRLGAVAA